MDLYVLEASPVYRASSRTVRATQRNPVSENKQKVQMEPLHPLLAAFAVVLATFPFHC